MRVEAVYGGVFFSALDDDDGAGPRDTPPAIIKATNAAARSRPLVCHSFFDVGQPAVESSSANQALTDAEFRLIHCLQLFAIVCKGLQRTFLGWANCNRQPGRTSPRRALLSAAEAKQWLKGTRSRLAAERIISGSGGREATSLVATKACLAYQLFAVARSE